MEQSQKSQWLAVIAFCIAVGYVVAFAKLFLAGLWVADLHGHPLVADFLAPYAAGRMALQGHAAAAYNPWTHHAVQTALMSHGFKGGLAWLYPPQFYFVVAPLAALPYTAAFLLW